MDEIRKKEDKILAVIGVLMVIFLIMCLSTGCNRTIVDTNYTFNKAIIKDIGTVDIKSWTDYSQSDMVQVVTSDGTVYLTHSTNIILIKD